VKMIRKAAALHSSVSNNTTVDHTNFWFSSI